MRQLLADRSGTVRHRSALAALSTLGLLTASLLIAGGATAGGAAGSSASRSGGRPAGLRSVESLRAVRSCAASPFDSELASIVESRWPGHNVTAAVFDKRTGCEFLYRPERRLTTASVFKVQIMAGVLLRAQQQGRGLTQWERDRLYPMINVSSDPDANALWSSLGGVAGMQALDRAFNLPETTPDQVWGLTVTSARDRTRLVRQILDGEYGPLTAPYRALARFYMTHVTPSQHWGISAGLPAGWSVALKNGFFSSSCCRWRIGSTGFINGPGGAGYGITVMTDGWPSDRPGIAAVEFVARAVALRLASAPFPPFTSADAAVRQQYADLFGTRPSLSTRLSLNSALRNDARRLPNLVTLLLADPRLAPDRPLARLYLGGLLRPPSVERYDHWLALLRTHRIDLRGVAVDFARSAEFAARYGGLASGPYIDLLYRNVLGRPADAAGRRYWLARLRARALHGDVLLALTSSPEGQRHWRGSADAVLAYRLMLRRALGPAEASSWTGLGRRSGYTPAHVVATVLASGEYRRRFPG